jgi:hypothetical protein
VKYSLIILCVFFSFHCVAQIFPNESGQILIDHLVADYKPNIVLDYNTARDTLYSKITNKNDSVVCVYTGFVRYLPPNEDPTTFLYDNASVNSINCEHTYPRSKGADAGNGLSDMHHMFPSRENANADRGNLPFGEIPDNQTTAWYLNNIKTSVIPTINKDLYSEGTSNLFEPREDHKGNVARAMMYFYTMYNPEAMAADPVFFNQQKETLCDWHFQDQADAAEIAHTYLIAKYQDGKPNPFVVDCTLPTRTYCLNTTPCIVATDNLEENYPKITIFPNPTTDFFEIKLNRFSDNFHLKIININHQLIAEKTYFMNEKIDISSFPQGVYFLTLTNEKTYFVAKLVKQ